MKTKTALFPVALSALLGVLQFILYLIGIYFAWYLLGWQKREYFWFLAVFASLLTMAFFEAAEWRERKIGDKEKHQEQLRQERLKNQEAIYPQAYKKLIAAYLFLFEHSVLIFVFHSLLHNSVVFLRALIPKSVSALRRCGICKALSSWLLSIHRFLQHHALYENLRSFFRKAKGK